MSKESTSATPPILAEKHYDAPLVFDVANLMREARRQKRLTPGDVPPICVLDPDGDLVDYLRAARHAHQHPAWACYHAVWDGQSVPRYSGSRATLAVIGQTARAGETPPLVRSLLER